MTTHFLANYAAINIKDALARVDGLGKTRFPTNFEYAMQV
ncbi:hypothetical protein METH_08530 [Leisingera methylohalidivorans DSM 14336]|uniref:Uncharacterized protein n=1 Tax=Leisingera methylohalidivorans DSM 14336 TaxID=999552 RepID=V9VYH2_9RHOB|nr:hypothetical protein METH_08530 [Leisingera methylohalidivorans DSM 14336]